MSHPAPTELSTLIEPPIAAHTLRTTHSPMPNPPLRLASGPRSNRSKMTSCLSGWDADAVVSHGQRRITVVGLHGHLNRTAGAESDGVRHQISADLIEPQAIPPPDDGRRRRHPHLTPGDGELGFERCEDIANDSTRSTLSSSKVDSSARES